MASDKTFKDTLAQLETTLDEYLIKKAPSLPENIKEILVKIAPYLTIISVVMMVPAVLALFGLGAFLSVLPFGAVGMAGVGALYYVGIVFLIITAVLQGLAIPGLFARTKQGWNYMFYASLVNAVQALVEFNLGGLIIGTVISLYLLFQVKSYYKN